MFKFTLYFLLLILVYSATEDSEARSLKQPIPPTIYYADGTTYTLKSNEIIYVAKESDIVYTKGESEEEITFTINYPNNKRDFDLDIVPAPVEPTVGEE